MSSRQKKLKLKRIVEKIEKGKKRDQYVQKRLKLCKSWGGPAVSVKEVHSTLKTNPNEKEVIVRNGLIYFRESHKFEVLYNPDLFKANGNTHKERLLNFCSLVAEDDEYSLCSLPTNADASLIVDASSPNVHEEKNKDVVVGHCYTTLITEGSSDTWYIASCGGEKMKMGLTKLSS